MSDRQLVLFSSPNVVPPVDHGSADGSHEDLSELTLAETNERSVIKALENIVFAQRAAIHHKYVDVNGDGRGEPLSLAEMLGVTKVRGSNREFKANRDLLSRFARRLVHGRGRHAGYLFQVWLRNASGEWITDGTDAVPGPSSEWRCYAWPASRGRTGRLVFFVDNSGEILASANRRTNYEEHGLVPRPDAADGARVRGTGTHANDAVKGADGGFWLRVSVYVPPPRPPK